MASQATLGLVVGGVWEGVSEIVYLLSMGSGWIGAWESSRQNNSFRLVMRRFHLVHATSPLSFRVERVISCGSRRLDMINFISVEQLRN